MEYGQGAIDLMEILGVDAEAVVGDLMEKLKSTTELANAEIASLRGVLSEQKVQHEAQLEEMNAVASDSNIEVKCRSCDEYYVLDYPLSEFKAEMSYCGFSERCCP